MGPPKKDDPASSIPMYYKEANTSLRETRFFLKPVQVTSAKGKFDANKTCIVFQMLLVIDVLSNK